MTVLDSSVAVDVLLGGGAGPAAEELIAAEHGFAAPDLIVFEVLSALRRLTARKLVTQDRASAAVTDFATLPLDLLPTLHLRARAWELRGNMTVGDALFVALAEDLDEPLVTKDQALAAAARAHSRASVRLVRGVPL